MTGPRTIEEVVKVTPAISSKMSEAIQLWTLMYEGKAPWIKEPTYDDPTRIVSLGLPSLIASEKARMATLEMESEITAPMKEEEKQNPEYEAPSIGPDGQINMGRGSMIIKEDVPEGPTERADFLNEQYKKLKKQIRRQLEYGVAKGGLAIKPYVVMYDSGKTPGSSEAEKDSSATNSSEQNNSSNPEHTRATGSVFEYDSDLESAEIEFDFVQADRFFPLSFDANGKVIEAAFIQTRVDKDKVYIRLEYHKLEGRTVTVQNYAFENDNLAMSDITNFSIASDLGTPIPLSRVAEWKSIQPKVTINNVDRLLFAYFKMPEANTIDSYSPLGVSGYSRVVSLIKDADMQYSRMLWEYEAGEMAIDVDRDAMKLVTEADGYTHSVMPAKQQRLFRKIDLNSEETYNVFAPALRDDSLNHGLNVILMRIEDACGISRGTLSEATSLEAKTATELKILKQRSFASNADIQQALEDALRDVVYVMDVYCDLYDVTPDGDYEISFEWDDSIIVDSETELQKRLTLMQNGITSKLETRMWYFGETENQAKQALQKVTDETKQTMETNMMAQAELGQVAQDASMKNAQKPTPGQQNNANQLSQQKSNEQKAEVPKKNNTITIGGN